MRRTIIYLMIFSILLINNLQADQEKSIKQLFGESSSHTINSGNRQGNNAASEGYFQKFSPHDKKIPKDVVKYNNSAYQAYFNGDYNTAKRYCHKVRHILERNFKKDTWQVIANENNLALLYQNQESYHNALTYYHKALKESKNLYGDGHPKTAIIYGNMAILYQQLGNLNKAFALHEKALEIRKKVLREEHLDTALSYQNLGAFYQNAYVYMNPRAYNYYQKALRIRKLILGDEHIDTAMTYSALSSLNYERGGFRTGMEFAYNAMISALKHVDKTHIKMATIYRNLGRLLFWMGNVPRSQKYLKKALTIRKSVLGNDHITTLEVYRDLILLGIDDNDGFLQRYKYAIHVAETFLKKRDTIFPILEKEEKEQYIQKYSEHIALLFEMVEVGFSHYDQHFRENNYEIVNEVFNIWLNYKGSIFDSENAIASLYATTRDKKIKKQIDLLYATKRKLAKLYQSLPRTNEREQWKQQIKITKKEITQLNKLLAAKTEKLKQQQSLDKIDSKILASVLKKDELYIDFAKMGGSYYIFTLDHNGKVLLEKTHVGVRGMQSLRKDISTILESTKLSKKQLANLTRSFQEELSYLYSRIFNIYFIELTKEQTKGLLPGSIISIKSQLQKKKSLIISPDGILRLLPFEILYNWKKRCYLIEEKDIRYVPSGKELMRLHKFTSRQRSSKKDVVIFADPNFNTNLKSQGRGSVAVTRDTSYSSITHALFSMGNFAQLPGTRAEAKAIKSTLAKGSTIEYLQDDATESNLTKVKQPNILHIATHGFFINDNTIPNPMLKSGIALTGANKSRIKGVDDGIVTALKLSGLDLKGTDLVVLSACQTGVVDINSTDSVSGLSKAFIQAGAKDIVMSLWSVDDQATKELMTSFYQEMKQNKNYAKALKAAKLKMIKEGKHPFYWGAFVIYGL